MALTVRFSDGSFNSPTSWLWDFGDGTTSKEQNPIHSYAAAGTYTVKLTVFNRGGQNTLTKTNYVTVNPKGTVTYSTPHVTASMTPYLYGSLEHLPAGMNMGYMSGADWDPLTGEWFQAQEVNNNLLIHRYSKTGKWISRMILTDAGHGNQMSVERTGGALKIWVMWDQANGNRSVRRIQYNAATKSIGQSELMWSGTSGGTYAAPSIDQDNDLVCYRLTTGGQDTFKVYKLSDVVSGGPATQQGVTIQMGATSATTYQGHTIFGDSIYRITNIPHGDDNHESNTQSEWKNGTIVANTVDEWNWKTGVKVGSKDHKLTPRTAGSTGVLLRTEPEGLCIVTGDGKANLIGVWKIGSGNLGTYNEQFTKLIAIA